MRALTRLVAFLGSIFLLLSSAAYSADNSWYVVGTEGTVRTTQAMSGVQLISTGGNLSAGSVLSTGFDGRVVLSRGEQMIVVGPNSRMSLPAVPQKGETKILQTLGTLMFKVDKRQEKHFRVETPVIAAVVKGTTFTVTAGIDAHSVHVAEGAVEVTAANGKAMELVTAGRTVFVSKHQPAVISNTPPQNLGFEEEISGERGQSDLLPTKEANLQAEPKMLLPAKVSAGKLDFNALSDGFVNQSNNNAKAARQRAAASGAAQRPAALSNVFESTDRARAAKAEISQANIPFNNEPNTAKNGNAAADILASISDKVEGNGDFAGNGNNNGKAESVNGNGNANFENVNGKVGNENANGNAGIASENGNAGDGNGKARNNGGCAGHNGKGQSC